MGHQTTGRPSWDNYFLEMADTASRRSTCDRGRAGCVIVRDNQILATGYAGSPPGEAHCGSAGHLFEMHMKVAEDYSGDYPTGIVTARLKSGDGVSYHCVRTIHAEQNAIIQAAKHGIRLKGATLYCKMTPCYRCAMFIHSVGITRVVCKRVYQNGTETIKFFERVSIDLEHKLREVQQYDKDATLRTQDSEI